MSIYTEMKAAGVHIENHMSDLIVPVNETTKAILNKPGHEIQLSITTTFTADDGTRWFDIPFNYDPFWESKRI